MSIVSDEELHPHAYPVAPSKYRLTLNEDRRWFFAKRCCGRRMYEALALFYCVVCNKEAVLWKNIWGCSKCGGIVDDSLADGYL